MGIIGTIVFALFIGYWIEKIRENRADINAQLDKEWREKNGIYW